MLYLVRHGRTTHNASGRLLGRMDVPLDDVGRRQAEALGRVPWLHQASRVVTSPLARARETAAVLGPPVEVDERWTELDYGTYDGMPLDEVPDLWRSWSRDVSFTPEGGESLAAVGVRVREACEALWADATRSDVVVVTHVSPLKAAAAWAIGAGDEVAWRMFVDVASVSCVGAGRMGPALRSFNETHHRPSN
ncbi:MAG: histidine phosphatase family protein [Acidimicrobiales bacterium]